MCDILDYNVWGHFPLLSIIVIITDIVIGIKQFPPKYYYHLWKLESNGKSTQFYQTEYSQLHIRVVTKQGYGMDLKCSDFDSLLMNFYMILNIVSSSTLYEQ